MAATKSFDVSREGKDLRIRMQAGDMTVARLSRALLGPGPHQFEPMTVATRVRSSPLPPWHANQVPQDWARTGWNSHERYKQKSNLAYLYCVSFCSRPAWSIFSFVVEIQNWKLKSIFNFWFCSMNFRFSIKNKIKNRIDFSMFVSKSRLISCDDILFFIHMKPKKWQNDVK